MTNRTSLAVETKKRFLKAAALCLGLCAASANADHSWNNYHWARINHPPTLLVIDSMTPDWDSELAVALYGDEVFSGWGDSPDLILDLVPGSDSRKTRKRCKSQSGQIRACNAAYGFNGWLGLATIGLDSDGHIVQGTAKMNDSYASYWQDPAEKQHVVCQEIGHLFGLGHTSEDGSSQQTCMDYSSDINSQWPNAHDFEQLALIYEHVDSYNSFDDGTTDSGGDGGCNAPSGKGCNKPRANGPVGDVPPMGIRVHGNNKFEVWVAPRQDGGLWIHHLYLAEQDTD